MINRKVRWDNKVYIFPFQITPICLCHMGLDLFIWALRFGYFWVDLGAQNFTEYRDQYYKLTVKILENFVGKQRNGVGLKF